MNVKLFEEIACTINSRCYFIDNLAGEVQLKVRSVWRSREGAGERMEGDWGVPGPPVAEAREDYCPEEESEITPDLSSILGIF